MTKAECVISRFTSAVEALDAATRIPGLDGQAQVFARMEDVQLAMENLKSHQGKFTLQERHAAVRAVEASRRVLKRIDEVFRFVEEMLRERAGGDRASWTYKPERRQSVELPSSRGSVELNA